MRRTFHQCQLAADLVFDAPQFIVIVRPCHYVAMAPHTGQPLGMRFVQKQIDPFFVDRIGSAVTREGIHILGRTFEHPQRFLVIVDEHELIIEVIAVEQQPDRRSVRQPTIGTVGGQSFITAVRADCLR